MKLRLLGTASMLIVGCAQTSPEAPQQASATAPSASAPSSSPASAGVDAALLAPPPRGNDAERKSKNGSLTATVGHVPIIIQYGRPSVAERTIFGDLIPYGELWRTGADEATTLTLHKDAMVAGKEIKAGTYALFTIPGKETWTVVLNSQAKQWGAYKHDPAHDVLTAEVPATTSDSSTEVLTFGSSDTAISLMWEKVKVTIPITSK